MSAVHRFLRLVAVTSLVWIASVEAFSSKQQVSTTRAAASVGLGLKPVAPNSIASFHNGLTRGSSTGRRLQLRDSSSHGRRSVSRRHNIRPEDASQSLDNNDKNGIRSRLWNKSSSSSNINNRVKETWSRARSKSITAIGRILKWQSKKRKKMVMAAALAFSFLAVSSRQLDAYQSGSEAASSSNLMASASTSRPAVEIVQQQQHQKASSGRVVTLPSTSLRAISSTSSQYNDNHVAMTRGGGGTKGAAIKAEDAMQTTKKTFKEAVVSLQEYMRGPKSDTLLLLLATALITPLCKRFGTSPILGFLASGMLIGPNGFGLINGIHTTETLAELGIVFFLFEMGIELSFDRLKSMRKDVFGLGLSQFLCTAVAIAGVGKLAGLPANALVVLGGGLALSSSAFVLQLLKDKDQLATRFGKASFGVLLFQDLAVVPLLVVTPILAGGGQGLAAAVGSAVLKASMALGCIAFAGRVLVNPVFKAVASARSQEAFLGLILLTVLSMSFLTEGLGLSNTLGAFLAGVLLSETKYRYQVEADIAPFRGVLLGLFFVTVGFEIDVMLIASNLPLVGSIVVGIIAIKAFFTTVLSLAFGLSLSTSQQTGLILAQGGEFAFVAFGLARSLGILDPHLTKLMLTSVSLTMALTPALASAGQKIAKRLEEKSDFTHYLGQDRDASEIKESDDFAVVVGYGAVGKVVCELLDRKLIKYVGLELDPNKAIQARNKGLPVFYGDIGRQEVAEAFNVGKAKAIVVCIADKSMCNRAVIALRRWYPELKIFARAADADHASRLQKTLDVAAMVPILPEDNLLLTLPFGGAVLKALGAPAEEVNAILEAKRKEVLSGKGLEQDEESQALIQLGIDPMEKKKAEEKAEKKPVFDVDIESIEKQDNTIVEEEVDSFKSTIEAAAERFDEAKEMSPFVASVIGEACPEALEEEVELLAAVAEFENEPAPALEVVDVEIDPAIEEISEMLLNSTDSEFTPTKKDFE